VEARLGVGHVIERRFVEARVAEVLWWQGR
jgi:hypothetical protein